MTDAVYVRVSTEEQAKRGYSLSEQLRECRKKASNQQNVIEYIDDGFSGEFLDRPGLAKLRRDLKDGLISRVIILDPDRLSRKLMNQLIVSEEIEKKAKLIFVNGEYQKTPEGMLFYQMRGAIAEFEKAKITERMSRGRREKARQGKVLRDFKIYGYDYDKENEHLIINDFEGKVVQMIFELFINPPNHIQGINGIAKFLTSQGIPTKRGAKQWHRQVVRQILMNKTYLGEFYQNRWNTEGMLGNQYRSDEDKVKMEARPEDEWIPIEVPSIVDTEQFNHAQKLLEQSRRRWSGKQKHQYLLSGLLRCNECNNTMTGRKQKNWGKNEYVYTDVKNTAGAKNKGCGIHVKCEELDKQVWKTIRHWLNNPEEIMAASDDCEDNSFELMELERIDRELEKLTAGKNRLLDVLMDEDYEVDDIKGKLKEVNSEIKELSSRKREVKRTINSNKDENTSFNIIKEASEYYLSLKGTELNTNFKQELLRKIIREIRVGRDAKVNIFTF